MKPECRGWFGRLRCRFEARYDLGAADTIEVDKATFRALEAMIDGSRSRTYVCDVCVACGEQRMRPKDTPA